MAPAMCVSEKRSRGNSKAADRQPHHPAHLFVSVSTNAVSVVESIGLAQCRCVASRVQRSRPRLGAFCPLPLLGAGALSAAVTPVTFTELISQAATYVSPSLRKQHYAIACVRFATSA
jgi:hypothetical protein